MNLEAGLVLGNYRLVEKIGECDVAVKFLPEAFTRSPERRAFFEREAKAVAALSRPRFQALLDRMT